MSTSTTPAPAPPPKVDMDLPPAWRTQGHAAVRTVNQDLWQWIGVLEKEKTELQQRLLLVEQLMFHKERLYKDTEKQFSCRLQHVQQERASLGTRLLASLEETKVAQVVANEARNEAATAWELCRAFEREINRLSLLRTKPKQELKLGNEEQPGLPGAISSSSSSSSVSDYDGYPEPRRTRAARLAKERQADSAMAPTTITTPEQE